ncbi:threonine/serine dehydratase [Alicyclobacillus cycloheptanicus]|uniref:Threonine dehydratase n=1 Tax=Alicyclobacillus cycloheptanicus TaxID=1457 RepID=A0ABT9XH70_9BACL|nr:threonine/serine dehydratase [Alicyclobacillus cycloheptanicus]MDQ0189153.1 threonine dehydratase [Alicyclobacillus cycloheptanicus]WDM00346.1 threonine/serine dehydratase [Alicyclobacillus cycloheptanicus]
MKHLSVTLDDVRAAAERISTYIYETPLLYSAGWSERAGVPVYFKCENLQRTGSFKLRGATNKIRALVDGREGVPGVITASSGNHGQAVAYAAQQAGLPCVVVVPETVIAVKENAILRDGAEVIRCGTTSRERIELAERLAKERGFVFVPPYDDPWIVAGQGTVGLEIVRACPDVGTVIVPIGGGGLTAGTALTVKSSLASRAGSGAASSMTSAASPIAASSMTSNEPSSARRSVAVYAAEPALANDTWQSMRAGRIVEIGPSHTIADGLRSSHPGTFTFPFVQAYVDDVLLVEEADIEGALIDLLENAKLLVEPSGCASVAALARIIAHPGPDWEALKERGPVVCVLSGGNADLGLVAEVVTRRRPSEA